MTKYLAQDMIERHCAKLSATWPGGRADKAPTIDMFVSKAVWDMDEPESDEGQDMEEGIQEIVAQVWHKHWGPKVARHLRSLAG